MRVQIQLRIVSDDDVLSDDVIACFDKGDDRLEEIGLRSTKLTLQLQLPFQVGLVGFGLVAAAPDGPGDDESGFDPALC
jgi:hypothetical protein